MPVYTRSDLGGRQRLQPLDAELSTVYLLMSIVADKSLLSCLKADLELTSRC
ncbi:MAG: hypothetical protein QNJ72_10240 [Pleurocapsa sp. MO_226.B13]|nr:hypothetical protein [Pleurocapsa sp. MO_226.B13]